MFAICKCTSLAIHLSLYSWTRYCVCGRINSTRALQSKKCTIISFAEPRTEVGATILLPLRLFSSLIKYLSFSLEITNTLYERDGQSVVLRNSWQYNATEEVETKTIEFGDGRVEDRHGLFT